jgi:hypothetical protein
VPVGPTSVEIAEMLLQDAKGKAQSLEKLTLLPVQDAMVALRKTASALLSYVTRCCTPVEARKATEHFDEEVLKYLCEIQRVQRSELAALTMEEMLSPLMLGGTGIVAIAPVTAAGIPFLASVAMALPTIRNIVGDDIAYKYFEDRPTLRDVRVKHTYLNKSIPESTVAFATKYVDGAVGRSGEKIKVNGLQSKWALIFNKHRSKTRIQRLEEAAIDEPNQSRLTAALAARRRGTHEKFTAAVDKGTTMLNEEARLAFRYHFSLKLMENLPTKCLCGHNVGDGTHLLVCKKVNAGQIAAHDVAVRSIGAELNSYGVIVRYEQRATNVKEDERKRTDMELWFDGRSVAVDYTVPNTLNLKQRTPGLKYAPLEVRTATQNLN